MLSPDLLAQSIANTYQEWENYRQPAEARWRELRDYIFATDTHHTTNNTLPWKNSTHLPKLCQIRDNLHANYMSALFPNSHYVDWEGYTPEDDTLEKRKTVLSYMENKLRMGHFQTTMSQCVYDWIDYGNCFAMPEFIAEQTVDPQTGDTLPGFIGPRLVRISPLDIVFNPTAMRFEDSPKIIRSIKTLATLKADILDHPELQFYSDVFDKVVEGRRKLSAYEVGDFNRNDEMTFRGFGDFMQYFKSDYVELLDFYGDYYDAEEQKLYKNSIITVVDRSYIIRNIQNPSWKGRAPIYHCGWRLQQDNLYAMGPLDNLVGMQYRIDHLENAKADAYDLIVYPVMKVKGTPEDFDYGPGARIYVGDSGDVEFMRPDTSMLSADTQIQNYSNIMEEMAGAPKEAMGFRTPGEKTAFEMQILNNAANRIFTNKTNYFEETFLEPLINDMLESARRGISNSDLIRVLDDQFGTAVFMQITREDLSASGHLLAVGSRRFAENANMIQNLVQLYSSAIGQDPSVRVHWSGKELAKLAESLLGLQRYNLYGSNIRVYEEAETKNLTNSAQQVLGEQTAVTAGTSPNNESSMVQGGQPGGSDQNSSGLPSILSAFAESPTGSAQ